MQPAASAAPDRFLSTNFVTSPLIRLFAQWMPPAVPAPDADLAERLSPWVGAMQAIELHAAHRTVHALGLPARASARPARFPAKLAEDFQRTRMTLTRAIGQDPALPNEYAYAPYKRRHLDLQRQMEQMISALREHVREVLSLAAPPLPQLAVLDAAMHKVVEPREHTILTGAVAVLERRFETLRKCHVKDVDEAGREDDPGTWRRPGEWLHVFEEEWRRALLAELQLRLEPVAGLVEAAGAELNQYS
jgi:hypothetical protein